MRLLPDPHQSPAATASPKGSYGVHSALRCVKKPQLPISGRGKPRPYVTTKKSVRYVQSYKQIPERFALGDLLTIGTISRVL